MLENSIVHFYTETQYIGLEQVFCPMCEIWHENNTLCQIPGWED